MKNRLEPILAQKQIEVAELYEGLQQDHPIAELMQGDLKIPARANFKKMLQSRTLAVIAEIKRKSPSKGELAAIADPLKLAQRYVTGGANAISILTDQKFFNGHIQDLKQVADKVSIPIMRKDFIIDKVQIAEAAVAGASAVLCIIAAVGDKSKSLIEFAHSIGLDVMVEIHDKAELKIALDCGAEIIGVNNRNLTTFAVDTNTALELVKEIPDNIVKVAESGITTPALARQYYQAGFDAVLIGEALVKADNPEKFILECRDV